MMTSMLATFGVLSVVFSILAGPNYLIGIARRKIRPHRMTWFIFSLIGTTTLISQLIIGVHWSVAFTAADTVGSIVTFMLSLRYGVNGWTMQDKMALGLACAGIILSLIVGEPVVAICGVILADVCAMVLTLHKTYVDPDSESFSGWLLVGIGAAFSALAVGSWNFKLLIFPVYIAIASASVPLIKVVAERRLRTTSV